MIKLFRYLKPYRFAMITALLLVMARALTDLFLPTLTADIVNNGVVSGDIAYILRVGVRMLLVAAFGGVCALVGNYFTARASNGFARDLREDVFRRVESFSLNEFDKFGTSSLITRTTNDITQMRMVLMMSMRMVVMAPVMSIGGLFMAISKDATLSLVFVVALPVLFTVVTFIARKGTPLFRDIQAKLDNLNLILRERLTGIRVIRAFNRDEYEKKRFEKGNYDYTATAIRVHRIMSVMMPSMMMIMNLTTISIVWFGGIRISYGQMMVGDLMAFIQYGMHIMFSMFNLSMMFVMIPRAAASAARINEVLETQPEIVDADVVKKADAKKGYIEFENVTFSYPGAERPALRNISFAAGPGEVTAIIGGTGSGKSTLSSILMRFYDVDSGRILVNDVDIREMAQSDLRSRIGYVPQKAVLFSGTVAGNICYGKDDASEDEIRRALEIAQASDFVDAMPNGIFSEIAQGGTNVSGGQKQRLSIARALVRRPEIYIFDDSFSALDFKTDARLRAALNKETAESTVIIVAQRVSTIMDADRIIVLEDGEVVGIGTHQELMATNTVYQEIVSSQLLEEEIA
ncbi:MAG: ABC transporter ATP-binding protein [Firmicutes bacterium]|jgi:ATP-binding cassette subfamily B protein|nr:ABC transporter ATP-binding protein [Bacillota bacterium]